MLSYYIGSMAITAVIAVIVILSTGSRRDSLIHWWKLYALSMAVWTGGRTLFALSEIASSALFWVRVSYLGGIWLVPTGLWLGYRLIQQHPPKLFSYGLVFCFLFFSGFVFTPYFIPDVIPRPPFNFYDSGATRFYVVWAVIYTCSVVALHLSIYRSMKRSRGYVHNRIGYFFASGLCVFVAGGTTFPFVFNLPIPPWGVGLVPISLLLMGYAVTTQRVKDPLMVAKTVVVDGVVAMIGGLPLIVVAMLTGVEEKEGLFVIFMSFLIAPLISRTYGGGIRRWLDKKIPFSHYSTVTPPIAGIQTIPQVLNGLLSELKKIASVSSAFLLRKENDDYIIVKSFGMGPAESEFLSIPEKSPIVEFLKSGTKPFVRDSIPYDFKPPIQTQALKESSFLRVELMYPMRLFGEIKYL